MKLSVEIDKKSYQIKIDEPLDISIPLRFGGAQPNAYGVEKATAASYQTGSLVGDTRRGGSCNFEQIQLIPHCNGTHTECVGHITDERISVRDCLKDAFIPATLISVAPEAAAQTVDSYASKIAESDWLITKNALENAWKKAIGESQTESADFTKALIVRTLPNDDDKLTRTYLEKIPPFFTNDAMKFLVGKGVNHLLVDLPSIDRIFDEGKLSNHRIFWNVETASFELNCASRVNSTITELIFVPDKIADGVYLLNLQIAPFAADAAPSRPLLFKTNKINLSESENADDI